MLSSRAVRTQSYKTVQWSLKTMALGWFTYKSYEYCSGIDTLFAGSSVALIILCLSSMSQALTRLVTDHHNDYLDDAGAAAPAHRWL